MHISAFEAESAPERDETREKKKEKKGTQASFFCQSSALPVLLGSVVLCEVRRASGAHAFASRQLKQEYYYSQQTPQRREN